MLEKARELLAVQADTDGGYKRNAAQLMLAEVLRDCARAAVAAFIRKLDPEQRLGFRTGLQFTVS